MQAQSLSGCLAFQQGWSEGGFPVLFFILFMRMGGDLFNLLSDTAGGHKRELWICLYSGEACGVFRSVLCQFQPIF